jgi:hypothetical protein
MPITRKLLRRLPALSVLIVLLLFLLQRSALPLGEVWTATAIIAREHQFDYVGWELGALGAKLDAALFGVHPFMNEAARTGYVRAYMDDLARAQALDAQISAAYSDPNVPDPQAATDALRAERDTLRADLLTRQTLAESILEGQVSAVLAEQGFGLAGQLVPPLSMRFTQVPNLLIVSPRDEIRFDVSINLNPLPVEQAAVLEAEIEAARDVSALIVPLGGIALYPAIILETPSIPWAVDVFAHEWLHHYLFGFPLGLAYFSGDGFAGETRTINETTASVFGSEVGRLVLARYYPDLLPPEPVPPDPDAPPPPPPAFDFGAELDATRRRVDELLAAGAVEAAEAYMEERRQVFYANGYAIRRLNQAFFAFYGGYQAGSGGTPGAGGDDPIGPAVEALRAASPSLHTWIETMRGITTRDGLLAAASHISSTALKELTQGRKDAMTQKSNK